MGCCHYNQGVHCCGSKLSAEGAPVPCPACGLYGILVQTVTPRHTLRGPLRAEVRDELEYYFCETPHCSVAYYTETEQCFDTQHLINRIAVKDPSPQTPLCYCFKVTKGDVLEAYTRQGTVDVMAMIQEKMGQKACFCEKSNPRGTCCTADIQRWLSEQDLPLPLINCG